MPISDAHRSIIQASLTAVRERGIAGVALGGGNGLIGQGISDRFTADVDLLCRDEDNVPAVAEGISEELASAGYRVTLRAAMVGLVELVVAAPAPADDPGAVNDADASELQIAYFDFSDADDVDGLGPVASKDDLVGFKAAAWGGRHLERDAVDLAAAITVASYTTRQLIGLAMERDPGLAAEDWSEAMDWFDTRMTDADLADYCSGGLTPAKVRESLADWPRTVDEWAAFLADVARETPI